MSEEVRCIANVSEAYPLVLIKYNFMPCEQIHILISLQIWDLPKSFLKPEIYRNPL